MTVDTQTADPPTPNPHYTTLSYRYPVARLWSGGSYGNPDCFARTDRVSNLDGFWHAATNEWLCGRLDLSVTVAGQPLVPQETTFFPGHQQTSFTGGDVQATKLVFVPYGLPPGSSSRFYAVLSVQADQPTDIEVVCDVRWPAVASRVHTKQPERHHGQRRVRQWQEGATVWAATQPFRVDRWDTTLGDPAEVRALCGPGGATATFSEPGRVRLDYTVHLTPGTPCVLPFTLVAGARGEDHLRTVLAALPDWASALAGTQAAYEAILTTALIHTPDAQINRGLQWAKANTVRVQHHYRQGVGFTNDPPQDIVVVRDCAWYALGADWLTPDFVQAMNTLLLQYGIEAGGKLTEYLHADTGQREDYALNINDDTPLFIVAAVHHYAVSGAGAFLEAVYPAVRAACAWTLAQRREGLVWCTAEGSDVWGNATWRNIIPGYTLVGAVTEINALCAWALREAATLAEAAGQGTDAVEWRTAAADLEAAINARLGTDDGLYLLNRHAAGANPTRTADLVFPVLSGVAAPERARRILDLLYGPAFYTPYGIHTVAADEAEYHPNFGHGLMGGLWPNLTAWVAYAGRADYPDRLAAMMASLYALSEVADPAGGGHLVPGEFPEWFDGETLESRGMAMSPWMPPTYLWLGIEGLAGVTARPAGLAIQPNLPPGWGWLALRNLPYRGERLSCFVHGGRLHTTRPVESAWPQTVYTADVSDELTVTGDLCAVALRGDQGVTVLVGAAAATTGTVRHGRQQETVRLAAGEARLIRWPESAQV
jgi:hypothetical protein